MTTRRGQTGIYEIVHLRTRKRYIGCAKRVTVRWATHETQLTSGKHPNKGLQRAFDADGFHGLEFAMLEECEGHELLERERLWIEKFEPKELFNVHRTTLGFRNGPDHGYNGGRSALPRWRAEDVRIQRVLEPLYMEVRCLDCRLPFVKQVDTARACPKCDDFNLVIEETWLWRKCPNKNPWEEAPTAQTRKER